MPADDCGSVRLTRYSASDRGWCEYDRTLPVLPNWVRQGLTLAIAEPYNGSSYGGVSGESCGECWEISTIHDSAVVMVHDLCPIEGNPLCAGGHFHFDLSGSSADRLQGGSLDEAQARRLPCPVTGNVHLQINDRNQWGYLRLQFVNHRLPIRTAEYQIADGGAWRAITRSGGAWHVVEDNETFAQGSPGGRFRLTSAQGEVVEGSAVLPYSAAVGSTFDVGVQFTDQNPAGGGQCVFTPPAEVYADGYGGIPEVRWAINPWGSASASESTDGCRAGSCIRVDNLAQWSGFHLYYRQAFPSSTFSSLSVWVRTLSGNGEVNVAASHEGTRCGQTSTSVSPSWTQVTIDVASECAGQPLINGVTMDNPGPQIVLLVDDVQFTE
jgi:expansin (peptidoglycan-binding protein)